MNALVLLRAADSRLLSRRIFIHVLDPDERGPQFGGNALAALSAEGEPLAGLGITFLHDAYDWNEPQPLSELMQELIAREMIVGASSEGGLFEYGSDNAIVANLKALNANGRGATAVVGSVTRADPLTRESVALSMFNLIPRGVEYFETLIYRTGYEVTKIEPGLMGDQVLLTQAPGPRQ